MKIKFTISQEHINAGVRRGSAGGCPTALSLQEHFPDKFVLVGISETFIQHGIMPNTFVDDKKQLQFGPGFPARQDKESRQELVNTYGYLQGKMPADLDNWVNSFDEGEAVSPQEFEIDFEPWTELS